MIVWSSLHAARSAAARRRRRGCGSRATGWSTPRSICMSQIITLGMPVWKRYQVGDGRGDVVGVVEAPVGAREDLLREVRVGDDRVDRDVGQVAGLVRPGERGAVGRAGHLEDVAGRGRRVVVEAADGRVADQRVRVGSTVNVEDRAVGQDGVAAGHIHPGSRVAAPLPRPKPYCTLPSLVPTIAVRRDRRRIG